MKTPTVPRSRSAWWVWVGLVAATVSSCCTKTDCAVSPTGLLIRLYGFPKADVDTVWVKQYAKGSALQHPLDSSQFAGLSGGDSVTFSVQHSSPYENDYRILVGSRVYELTGFEILHKEDDCNSCFLTKHERSLYDVLLAYRINGQRREGGMIRIYN